jgi:hypothetical protein
MYDKQDMNLRVYKGFTINRENPFGFWKIDTKVPELNQSFTMIQMARSAIDEYLKKTPEKKKKD